MGLLDRFAYRSLDVIPRNWEMTSLDVARIEMRNEALLLALDVQSRTQRSTQPPQLTLEDNQERSNSIGTLSVMAACSSPLN
jgi:hypothetical protein